MKKFDAVVGDTSIVSKRWEQAEFSHPYTEPGLMMIVPEKVETSNRAWLFMKPFTKAMWVLTGAITIYNGFTLWLIERNQNPELMTGSILNQMGTLVCLSFTTLFSMHGKGYKSSISSTVFETEHITSHIELVYNFVACIHFFLQCYENHEGSDDISKCTFYVIISSQFDIIIALLIS